MPAHLVQCLKVPISLVSLAQQIKSSMAEAFNTFVASAGTPPSLGLTAIRTASMSRARSSMPILTGKMLGLQSGCQLRQIIRHYRL
jgi:hypothetical protein